MYRSRAKFGVLTAGCLLFAIVGLLGGLSGGGWGLWLAALFFGPLGIFSVTQLLDRKPAIVIDREGISDPRTGLRLAWSEVEGVRLMSMRVTRFSRQHWLLLRVSDIESVVERLPKRFGRTVGRLDAKLGFREAAIVLNLLDRSRKEILDAVDRYYDGPVER